VRSLFFPWEKNCNLAEFPIAKKQRGEIEINLMQRIVLLAYSTLAVDMERRKGSVHGSKLICC
jgi:hypothetical protein